MGDVIGQFDEVLHARPTRDVRVTFCDPALGPRWAHSGLTADFFAAYLTSTTPDAERRELLHNISYFTNELLENGVKFGAGGPVEVSVSQDEAHHVFQLSNEMPTAAVPRFQALLRELTERDPGELLLERLEANAANPESRGSGLGFLTMMSDYGAALGWKFEPVPSRAGVTRVTTMITLPR